MATRTRVGTWLDRRRRHRLNEAPPPVPPGWVVAPPDVVGIGAQKAVTSWWFELLVAHPGMTRPRHARKELRYFNRFGVDAFGSADVDRYHQLFARPSGLLCGEWTPSYMVDHWVPGLLHRAAPDARLLAILRDPVERYSSGLAQMAARGRPVGLAEHRQAFERGCYAGQIERVLEHHPRDRLLVLTYDECTRAPHQALARTYRFLDLDADFEPEDLTGHVHRTSTPKPRLEPDRLQDLVTAYRPEVARLSSVLPDLDLQAWSSAG